MLRQWFFDFQAAGGKKEHPAAEKLPKVNHPWTNGQVERMNRTIKEANVKRYYYETHQQLKDHLKLFLTAYNFAR